MNFLPALAETASTNAEARISFRGSPSTETTEYSRSGFTAANWLLGSVQGVVVQTSRSALRRSSSRSASLTPRGRGG